MKQLLRKIEKKKLKYIVGKTRLDKVKSRVEQVFMNRRSQNEHEDEKDDKRTFKIVDLIERRSICKKKVNRSRYKRRINFEVKNYSKIYTDTWSLLYWS